MIFAVPHKKMLDSGLEGRKIRLVAAHKAMAPTEIHPNNKEKHHVFYR
jgi:hypothetical protein